MKKMMSLLMMLVMCVTLVACGGTDKQAVIDVFNQTSTVFDELVNLVNANIDTQSQEMIDVLTQMSNALLQTKELLESDQELTEEEAENLIAQLTDIEAWVADAETLVKADIENAANAPAGGEEVYADKQAVIDYFNMVSPMFDATATAVNANIDAFSDEFVNTLVELAGTLTSYKEILESDYQITQEEYDVMMQDLATIEQWLMEIEKDVFG